MSEKHEQLTADGKYRTVYGYDNPLETFYFQVFEVKQESSGNGTVTSMDDSRSAEGPVALDDDSSWERDIGLVAWLGTLTGEIPTVETLIDAAAPYVVIPDATIEKLKADQQSAPGPTALQRAMRM